MVVEHSYGRLKGRWRCLLKHLDVDISDAPEVVAACCILHCIKCVNFMMKNLMNSG